MSFLEVTKSILSVKLREILKYSAFKGFRDSNNRYHKHGLIFFLLVIIVAVTIFENYLVPLTLASSNQKSWDTKSDFENATLSNVDTTTNDGYARLSSTNSSKSDDFSSIDNYDSANSSQVNWDTAAQKLSLAGGDTGNLTNLTSKISQAWTATEHIVAIAYDSSRNRQYYGGSKGSLGYISGGTAVDLTPNIHEFWKSTYITSMCYMASTDMVYLGGSNNRFAKYNGTSFTDLSDQLSATGFWPATISISSLACDNAGQKVYIGGSGGVYSRFASYNGSTFTGLKDKLTDAGWPVGVYISELEFDSNHQLLYIGSDSSRFASYDGTNAVDLTTKISGFWSSSSVYNMSYDHEHNLLYLASSSGSKYAKYDGTNATDLSSTIASISFSYIYGILYNPNDDRVYIGGGSGYLAVSDGTNAASNITSKISPFWGSETVYALSYGSVDAKMFLGGADGRFASYDGTNATNLAEVIRQIIVSYFPNAIGTAYGDVFIAGIISTTGGLARYDPDTDTISDISAGIGQYTRIYAMYFDSTRNLLYLGGDNNCFFVYNGTNFTDLSAKAQTAFSTDEIYSITMDEANNLVYLGGKSGKFAKYNATTNTNATDLTSTISGFWSTSSNIRSLSFDTANNKIYLIGSYNEFARSDGTSAGEDLISKISVFWTYFYGYSSYYSVTENKLYIGGGGGAYSPQFVRFDGTNAENISASIASAWGSSNRSVATIFAGTDGLMLGGGYSGASNVAAVPKFGKWANGTFTDLSTNYSGMLNDTMPFGGVQLGNTSYLLGNYSYVGRGSFVKYEVGYKTTGSLKTNTLDLAGNNIKSAILSSTESKPTGTAIEYYISADGGSHWEAVSLGVTRNFTNAGSDLRLRADLSTSNIAITPEILDLSINYNSLNSYSGSINLVYDATREVNFYSLGHTATAPSGSSISYKVRTAPTQLGLQSATWGDQFSVLPYSLTANSTDNRWIEIEADLLSTQGLVNPEIDRIVLDYIDNDRPEIDAINVNYKTDGSKDLEVSSSIRDVDTQTNPTNDGEVSLSYQYSLNSGSSWNDISNEMISGSKGLVGITGSFANKSSVIDIGAVLDETYNNEFAIKLIVNDNELARNTSSIISGIMTIDSKKPTNVSYNMIGSSQGAKSINLFDIVASDDSTITQMIISLNSDFADSQWLSFSEEAENISADSGDTIYLKVKDIFGNESAEISYKVPIIVQNIVLSDLSNSVSGDFRLALGWSAIDSGDVVGYKIFRKTAQTNFELLQSVNDETINGIVDSDVLQGTEYEYIVYALDDNENMGIASGSVSGQPAFIPTITNIEIGAINFDEATISWDTDVACDSFVEFGVNDSYGAIQGSSELTTNHIVNVTGLNEETIFHFRVRSRDQKGTLGISSDDTFTTSKDTTVRTEDQTKSAPRISNVKSTDTNFESSVITWETNVVTVSEVQYGKQINNYADKINDQSSSFVTQHTIKLQNLSHGTVYHFRVVGTDMLGNKYASDDYIFETLSMPSISSMKIAEVSSFSASIEWNTNTLTNGYVIYGPKGSSMDQMQGNDLESSQHHVVVLKNLLSATKYDVKAKSMDKYGNTSYSDLYDFTTTVDTKSPEISNLRSESSLITNETGESTVQVIVSWTTDEAATSQVKYSEGTTAGNNYPNSTIKDESFSTGHIVIITGLKPSTTYHMIAISADNSGNIGTSKDYTLITKRQEKSMLEIIIQTLEDSFSWVKSYGLGI